MFPQNKIAIILWLYHTYLAQEFIDLLKPHNQYINIFLALCKDHDNTKAEQLFSAAFPTNLHIEYLDNGGTDVLPTLKMLELCQNDHPIFFKLHSKVSTWGVYKHVNWRSILLNDILHKENFYNTVKKLSTNHIGIVGSKSFILAQNENTNSTKINKLFKLFNWDNAHKLSKKEFVAGNIFAAKTELFLPFINNSKLNTLLSQEIGHVKDDLEGTYVHSMERIFGYIAEYNNQKIFGAPYKTIVILNPKIKNHKLHLIILYNEYCYIQENPNIYGKIIDNHHSYITINWLNPIDENLQTYKKFNRYLINKKYVYL